MDEAAALLSHAHEFLESAHDAAGRGHHNVAYDLARTAAELAGKCMLSRLLGSYPRRHDIGGILARHDLLFGLDPRRTTHLLRHHTRGDYGYLEPVAEGELGEMLHVADTLVAAAER